MDQPKCVQSGLRLEIEKSFPGRKAEEGWGWDSQATTILPTIPISALPASSPSVPAVPRPRCCAAFWCLSRIDCWTVHWSLSTLHASVSANIQRSGTATSGSIHPRLSTTSSCSSSLSRLPHVVCPKVRDGYGAERPCCVVDILWIVWYLVFPL